MSVDALVAAIRDDIMAGVLGPGQRINQDEWATRMRMSRTPVRLALERLESEGFVKLVPHRGAAVTEMTTSYLEDILAGRLMLESSLGRIGARNLTSENLAALRGIQDEIRAVKLPEEHRSLSDPAERFHAILYEAAGTPMLQRFAAQVEDHSRLFLTQFWYTSRTLAQATKLHLRELYLACKSRDQDRVETSMRDARIDMAGVLLRDRVKVAELRVLPSVLRASELEHLGAIVDRGDEPWGPSTRAR